MNYFSNVFFVKYIAAAIGEDGSITLITSLSATHSTAPVFIYAVCQGSGGTKTVHLSVLDGD